MDSGEPNDQELKCLRMIASGRHGELNRCNPSVLERLIKLGLIERHPLLRMPLVWARDVYRVTPKGTSLLKQRGS